MRTIQFNQWYEIAKKSVQAALKSVYAKYFLVLFAIFLVALIPLFRANFNYIDDLGRIREGYLNFGFGRYTSNIAATVVNAGSSNHGPVLHFSYKAPHFFVRNISRAKV